MAKKLALGDSAEHALRLVEESNGFHDKLVTDCDKRWREFEGRLERNTQAAQWQSQLHPPYLNHIIETQLSGLLDDKFSFRIKPKPRLFNPGEADRLKRGAEAHEILARQQLLDDRFTEFQRPYLLDAAVCGIGIAKTMWRSERQVRTRHVVDNAAPGWLAQLGMELPSMRKVTRNELVFDGPVTEAIDPRDFYWHEGATSLSKSRFLAHAIWMTYGDLMALAKQGKYDMEACRKLERMTEDTGSGEDADRVRRGRRKDMIEVLEVWDRERGRVTTIGARTVLLRDSDWPFWHNEYPFVDVCLQPAPRVLRGMSVVEKLAHLQEMTWDLMNQRIDNVRFINNFIQILRSDADNVDNPFEPGATWYMDDPQSAVQWQPNTIPAEISIGAEAILKQDMQNLAGGQPFTSTSEARGIGADTATEAALVTNLAQMATKQMKARAYGAYGRIGQQRLWLSQQFLLLPTYAEKIGLDSQAEIVEILPHLLAGDYMFDIQPMNESLNRAERRAEANGRFQMFIQAAPALAALGVNMNYKALVEDVLDAWDEPDKERYFAAAPPPQQMPGVGGQAPAPELGPGGVTAPQSIDPAVSPSTQASLSPQVFGQRALASQGGVANT